MRLDHFAGARRTGKRRARAPVRRRMWYSARRLCARGRTAGPLDSSHPHPDFRLPSTQPEIASVSIGPTSAQIAPIQPSPRQIRPTARQMRSTADLRNLIDFGPGLVGIDPNVAASGQNWSKSRVSLEIPPPFVSSPGLKNGRPSPDFGQTIPIPKPNSSSPGQTVGRHRPSAEVGQSRTSPKVGPDSAAERWRFRRPHRPLAQDATG